MSHKVSFAGGHHVLQVVSPSDDMASRLGSWLGPEVIIQSVGTKPVHGLMPIVVDADAFEIPPNHLSQWGAILEPVISPIANPSPKVVWVSDTLWESWIDLLHHYHIGRVLPGRLIANLSENPISSANLLQSLWQPHVSVGLQAHLGSTAECHQIQMANSNDIGTTFEVLQRFFESHQAEDVIDLSTVLMEALTNAVYHAPRNRAGAKKYDKGQPIDALEPNEHVSVSYGWNGEVMGISIRDQWGSVNVRDMLFWLSRNVSGEGLFDTSGRGMYLMHTLVDRCVINLNPLGTRGAMTEVILLKRPISLPNTPKLLWINTP
jgi:anti-sigma regulatory factor (Ser/Thr protein kinase)